MGVALSFASMAPFDTVASGSSEAILSTIVDQDVQLAVWQRPRPCALQPLDRLDWTTVSGIDAEIPVNELNEGIARVIAGAGPGYAPVSTALTTELVARSSRFAKLFPSPRLRVRLDIVRTNACWKFHMDYVPARLLATLSGRGTEWRLTGQPDVIHAMAPGDVAIFKGRLLVDEPRVLHRSPPIADRGETRLLLAIDPVTPDRHRTD